MDADVRTPSRAPLDLPVVDAAIARLDGAAKVWDDLDPEARERLRRDAVVVVGSDGAPPTTPRELARRESMGAFYTQLREQRVPAVITIDALYAIVHVALERALADVEELELAPGLNDLLEKLETRLATERTPATTELAEAYRVARGVIAVARALATAPVKGPSAPTREYVPPTDLATVVGEERGHIEGHAGVATSPLLGVPLDYARFQVPSSAVHPGLFRALAWLGAAPLSLVARSEAPGSPVSVSQARLDTRAAMVLARLCDRDVDTTINAAYVRVLRLLAFVWGPPDDLSLTEIDDVATSAGIDLTNFAMIVDVTRVDRVRARAIAGRAPAAYDGSGGVGRAGVSVRLFGGHASADSLVMQGLVGAPVGLAHESASAAPVDRLRKGQRVLPSTLDVMAWLGAHEARAALHESRADGFDTFDAALSSLQRMRPDQGSALHASVHGSLVDSLIAWASSESSAVIRPTIALERARLESMLAAWTLMRHSGQVLSRTRGAAMPPPVELKAAGPSPAVFVEPLPDVVARLVGAVRQLRRGLEALGPLPLSSSAMLVEVEDILETALTGAERHASDESPSMEEATSLAFLPQRLARIDDDGATDRGPVVATVYSDPKSKRVLASATGAIEPILMLVRDAKRDEPMLVVGAHLAHHELVEGFANAPGVLHAVRPALTDAAWRARLRTAEPVRATWVSSFRWTSRDVAAPPPKDRRGAASERRAESGPTP